MSHNPSRLIGYARVSTHGQDTALQIDALKAAGCAEIFEDTVSGSVVRRPGLDTALANLAANDVLVVWKLDRLGRSLTHLVDLVNGLQSRGVGFRVYPKRLPARRSACAASRAAAPDSVPPRAG